MNTPIWGVGQRNPRHRPFPECREIGQSSRSAERAAADKNLGVRQFSECHAGGRRIRGQPQLPLNSTRTGESEQRASPREGETQTERNMHPPHYLVQLSCISRNQDYVSKNFERWKE